MNMYYDTLYICIYVCDLTYCDHKLSSRYYKYWNEDAVEIKLIPGELGKQSPSRSRLHSI